MSLPTQKSRGAVACIALVVSNQRGKSLYAAYVVGRYVQEKKIAQSGAMGEAASQASLCQPWSVILHPTANHPLWGPFTIKTQQRALDSHIHTGSSRIIAALL